MQMQEGGEEMMTKNAVQQIEEAEHKAKEYQALAVEQAKKLLSDAERQGQAALEQALREAEAQRREQDTQAEQAAQLRADAIMTEARRACDGLRRQAEERLPTVRNSFGNSSILAASNFVRQHSQVQIQAGRALPQRATGSWQMHSSGWTSFAPRWSG